MHMLRSSISARNETGMITQLAVVLATFGFVGFVLNRPHLFAIRSDEEKKREGYLHFWAVMSYMMGVQDEFNVCLLPLKAAQIEYDIIMRNMGYPYIQAETRLFRKVVGGLVNDLNPYNPLMEYDSQVFIIRRACGVPGYQHWVDKDSEKPYRNIFTKDDIMTINCPLVSDKILLLRKENDRSQYAINNCDEDNDDKVDLDYHIMDAGRLCQLIGVPGQTLHLIEVERDFNEYRQHLNANEYENLNNSSKLYLNANIVFIALMRFRIFVFVAETLLNFILFLMGVVQRRRLMKIRNRLLKFLQNTV